jgi:RNA polymerase sigma factor FliA
MALSEEEYELWSRYRQHGDDEARDFLFLQYAPWARSIAANVYSRLKVSQMEWADFSQNATVGLLEAMARFDAERGLDFMAYAKLRVQGSVFNGVRVFMTGVDRGTRADRSQDRIDHLAADESESGDLLSAFIDTVAGLGAGLLLERASPTTAEGLQKEMENQELAQLLATALQRLPERERMVLTAHYINQVPNITDPQGCSREHSKTASRAEAGCRCLPLAFRSGLRLSKASSGAGGPALRLLPGLWPPRTSCHVG